LLLEYNYVVIPPNMVCVTTLSCNILITTLFVFTSIHYFKRLIFFFLKTGNLIFVKISLKNNFRRNHIWWLLLIYK